MGPDPAASWWWSWGWKPDLLAWFEEVAWPSTLVSHSFSFPQELCAWGEIRKCRRWSGEKENSSGWSWVALVPQCSQISLMSLRVALRRPRSVGVAWKWLRGVGVSSLGAENSKVKPWVCILALPFSGCVTLASYFTSVTLPLWNSAFSSAKGWLNAWNDVMLVKGIIYIYIKYIYSSCSI